MEALNQAYAGRGISFYWVLSREPHPGFYGFTQTDSLEMRREYVRLADAELSLQIPWIIDDMQNTMQKAYGRRPNSEFIVTSDGTLLESTEWADPDKLKAWLEKNIGPSGISDEKWAELSEADQTARSVGNNDEVPMTEVPRQALQALNAIRIGNTGEAPFTFDVGTLPPNITSDGQSRLYFTITPDEGKSFDKTQVITFDFSEFKGIKFGKDKLKSGKRRSRQENDQDIYPHTVGVLWSLDGGAARITFKAKISATMNNAEVYTAEYQVSGAVPATPVITDQVSGDRLPSPDEAAMLTIEDTGGDSIPMKVEARILPDASNAMQGTIFLYLKVEQATGHHWNNLSPPPYVTLKPVAGVVLDKTRLHGAQHDGEGDTVDRVLAVRYNLQPDAKEFTLEATPSAWICHDEEGWCRLFTKTYRVTGKSE